MRAFVELWDEITRERYGVQDPKMRRFRYGVQVNSLGLTEAQPENNVQRIVLEMLGVTLSKNARARALQLPAWNEALGLPRPWDQQWSLRLQQVLAFESDLLEYDDIFEGSVVINAKVAELVGYAEAARRDGLLALDEVTNNIEDPFTKKGLQLVVDGTDPDLVADILESENDAMRKRHAAAVQPFDKAGGYAPTMGIIGTVFGLIHVLGNLDQPETLGPMIAAAFIATLLGVASANVVFLPAGARLKQLSQEELHARALIVEGILSIQAGDNPRVVQEKLITFVPPKQRLSEEQQAEAAAAAKAAAAA
jgi:flagellar motor component MotA